MQKNSVTKLLLRLLLLTSIAAAIFSYFADSRSETLPQPSELLPQLFQEPLQSEATQQEFRTSYQEQLYTISPVASYELWGLVVTHNNILALDDIYHDETSIDIKDICVIWGENLQSDEYLRWNFWSEPWTCFFQAETKASHQKFEETALGNNHLLATDPLVQKTIRQARIGDQIHLRGQLVDYQNAQQPGFWRRSSTTRDDEANGACEVVLVQEFNILQAANQTWRSASELSTTLAKLLAVCCVLLFVYDTYFRK
jgi:hypothetical protein